MRLQSQWTPQSRQFFGCVVDGCAGCVEFEGVVGFTGGGEAVPAGVGIGFGSEVGAPGSVAPAGGVGGFGGVGWASLCSISSTSKMSSDFGGIC